MERLTIVLSILSSLFTVLPLIRSPAWWIRIFDFPRTQVAFLCILSIGLLINYHNYRTPSTLFLMIMVAVAFIYQVILILKFTPLHPVNAPKAKTKEGAFKVMQANVKMDNRKAEQLKKLIDQYAPDIISLNETDTWWAKELADLDALYPYSIKQPLSNTYGMMMLSKFELRDTAINFLVDKEIPSFYASVILPSGDAFDLHCLHPIPPKPGTSTYERDTEILIVGKKIKTSSRPAMVVGDLNDVAWSYTTKRFRKYSGVLDPRIGRGTFNTYNANIPMFRYPLDHFFYTPDFGLVTLQKLETFGSDHYPMLISLALQKNSDKKVNA